MTHLILQRIRKAAVIPGLLLFGFSAQSVAAAQIFSVNFTQINGVGASGTAALTLNDDATSLLVELMATGLEPGGPHVGHIHGLFSEVTSGTPVNSVTPTPAQDSDGDGFIELGEGLVTYGPIIIAFGNVDPDLDGIVDFSQTFDLTDAMTFSNGYDRFDLLGADLMSLDLREIVIHGMTVAPGIGAGTPGEVNGTNGYLAVLPVLSGEIQAVPEPATWAMMIIGFGAVGMSLRSTDRSRRIAATS